MRIFENPNYNFIQWRWHAIALSLIVILAGLAVMVTRGLPLGIDFSGGTIVVLKFQQPVGEDALRSALDAVPGDKVVQQYGEAGANEWLVRLPELTSEQGVSLEQGARAVVDAVTKANLGSFEVISQELVGPVIGADLQRKGIYATLASIVGITIYIGIRFRFAFAIGAIAATLHDVLVTLAFLTFFGYDLSLNIVAAILTITGYSVNDTIVIFDRVRENLRSKRRDSLETRGQPERQPDPRPHHHHRRHDVPGGAVAVPVRRRGAGGLRVHDAGGHRQRHLLDGLHRGRHCHSSQREPGAGPLERGRGRRLPDRRRHGRRREVRHVARRGSRLRQPCSVWSRDSPSSCRCRAPGI